MPHLADFRKQAGLSQEQLAAKAGISKKTICRLEQGANARYDTISRLAVALRVPRKRLIGERGISQHVGDVEENA